MSVIVRLQNLAWTANAVDIRQYFHGLSIPEGGVHIVGGELGDAFIAFSTDEDARQAMLRDGGKVKETAIKLYLSSRAEMQKIIEQARQHSLGMQQFMSMPTITPITVPVTSITVPTLPASSVSIPNVQNVQAMQVPLQNVAAMVTNIGKPDPNVIGRSAAAVVGVQSSVDNKSVASNQSIKSDTEKDKKDKRRSRRTRSHSRDSTNSRSDSRSRSRSRSSSRSRDRKSRDRHHDRRRKRSRSRDRRRRRDRSRSRERSYRDRKKDHSRHGSKEEFEDSNQSSRWNNPAQRNRSNKIKSDLYNRELPNQNKSHIQQQQKFNAPKAAPNATDPAQFSTNNTRQINSIIPDEQKILPPLPQVKDLNLPHPTGPIAASTSAPTSASSNSTPLQTAPQSNQNTEPSLPIPQNAYPVVQNSQPPYPGMQNPQNVYPGLQNPAMHSQNLPPNMQGYYGSLPPPPMFNPSHMVGYPNYSPNPNDISQFNAFPPMPPQMMNPVNIQKTSVKQEPIGKSNFDGNELRNSPTIQPPGPESIPNQQLKSDLPKEREKPRFGSEILPNDIPLPGNEKIQVPGLSDWGYNNMGYPYGRIEPKSDSVPQSFKPGWGIGGSTVSSNNGTTFNKPIMNACVQVKNVPPYTKHDDIRAFLRLSSTSSSCLKVVGGEDGQIKGVYVKFNSAGEKKKAICRSGCLLNNAIVTVLHVDDSEFEKAVDMMDIKPEYWNPDETMMNMHDDIIEDTEMMIEEDIQTFNCIKFEGTVRFHPFFNSKHKIHPHIKALCENFNPVDVCVVKLRGPNHMIHAFLKFENSSSAEGAVESLKNVKVEGRPVIVSLCSLEVYEEAKDSSIAMDAEHFLMSAKSRPRINAGNPGIKQEDRIDPRLQSSTYVDKRTKFEDINEKEKRDDNIEAKSNEDEAEPMPEPEFKRSNKVLLPTPPSIQLPFQKDCMGGLNTNCVFMQNLPLHATDHDIIDFFSDMVVPTQIHIMLDSNGKQYGDAYCEFESNEEAASASTKNNSFIGRNNIHVELVSRQEMQNALGLSVLTSGPSHHGGPPHFFNSPPGPHMYGPGSRMDAPRMGGKKEWMPFHSGGGPPGGPDYNTQGERGFRQGIRGGIRGRGDGDYGGRGGFGRGGIIDSRYGSGRGRDEGGRGGRGMDRGRGMRGSTRGFDSGRGSRGGGDGMVRGGRGGGDFGRGRGRGIGRGGFNRGGPHEDMSDGPRNQPPDLMSISPMDKYQSGGPPSQAKPSAPVTRPIQLEEESVREFGQPGCVVSAENVPYRAELTDILEFFENFDLSAESIIRRYNDSGQCTGDARIAFKTPAEAKRAIKFLNKKPIGNRKIVLSLFK